MNPVTIILCFSRSLSKALWISKLTFFCLIEFVVCPVCEDVCFYMDLSVPVKPQLEFVLLP